MDQKKFDKLLKRHADWLKFKWGGSRLRIYQKDLSCVKAVEADLRFSDFTDANMRGADLSMACMNCACFYNSDLSKASLENAVMERGLIAATSLAGASLRWAHFETSRFVDVDFTGADLTNAGLTDATFHGNITLNNAALSWSSRGLLSEVLWQAAKGDEGKEQLAAFVARKSAWCWDNWIKLVHPHKEWAIKTLAEHVRPGDGAPLGIRRIAEGWKIEDALAEWETSSS